MQSLLFALFLKLVGLACLNLEIETVLLPGFAFSVRL